MKKNIGLFLWVLILSGAGLGEVEYSWAGSGTPPALSEVVFFGLRPIEEPDMTQTRQEFRRCLKTYLEAGPAESLLRQPLVPSDPEESVVKRRRNLEEQIVVLIGEEVRRKARSFAQAFPLSPEWEGLSEGPVMRLPVRDTKRASGRSWPGGTGRCPARPEVHPTPLSAVLPTIWRIKAMSIWKVRGALERRRIPLLGLLLVLG